MNSYNLQNNYEITDAKYNLYNNRYFFPKNYDIKIKFLGIIEYKLLVYILIINLIIYFIISYFVNMTVHNILAKIPKNNPKHILASVFIISSISKGEFIILNRYFNTLSILGIITGG